MSTIYKFIKYAAVVITLIYIFYLAFKPDAAITNAQLMFPLLLTLIIVHDTQSDVSNIRKKLDA